MAERDSTPTDPATSPADGERGPQPARAGDAHGRPAWLAPPSLLAAGGPALAYGVIALALYAYALTADAERARALLRVGAPVAFLLALALAVALVVLIERRRDRAGK